MMNNKSAVEGLLIIKMHSYLRTHLGHYQGSLGFTLLTHALYHPWASNSMNCHQMAPPEDQ